MYTAACKENKEKTQHTHTLSTQQQHDNAVNILDKEAILNTHTVHIGWAKKQLNAHTRRTIKQHENTVNTQDKET